ncbi:MAG: ABC transporter permease [Clostridiales bacterium]|jgi:hypothetical protein|nr:ABC transporter permease [Clostridiales bacterium]
MLFFKTALWLTVKRLFMSKSFLLSMAILPAVMLAAAMFLHGAGAVVVIRAGFAFDAEDAYARAIAEGLPEDGADGILFEPFGTDEASLAEMKDKVMRGALECAYIVKEDLAEEISAGRFREIITLIKSPKTVAEAILNETVSAAVLRAGLTDISANEIVRAFHEDLRTVRPVIEEKIAGYYGGAGQFVQPAPTESGTAEKEGEGAALSDKRILHGVAALYMMTATAFLLPRFIDEKNRGSIKRLFVRQRIFYLLALFSSVFVCNFLFGLLSVGVAGAAHPAGLSDWPTEITGIVFYAGAVAMLGLLLISVLKKSDVIYTSFVFLPAVVFCLGGIVFDLAEISASLQFVPNLFLTGAYIHFILYGETQYLGLLFLVFIVSLIGTIFVSTKGTQRRKKNA